MDQQAKASRYEIYVSGRLSERLLEAFPELHARCVGGVNVLAGHLPDQAALHGVLSRIESLGLELLEVRRRSWRREPSAAVDRSTSPAAEDLERSA